MNDISMPRHHISRLRRETRRRWVEVAEIERLTPRMLRLHFVSSDLRDFVSAAPDDHIKLLFPVFDGGDNELCMRDYTPRRFDAERGTLTIDFALHEAGPATVWALTARVGDRLEIGGPRGSIVVTDDFDWYLLIGDETALPAIGRWIEQLRPGVPAISLAVIDNDAERQDFVTQAAWTALWVSREGASLDDAGLLLRALADIVLPPGDGYVWIAAEALAARALRNYVVTTLGHPEVWLKAAGYWTHGKANAHESIQA
jgi:NADPH-dependent ferric siderophore reductase